MEVKKKKLLYFFLFFLLIGSVFVFAQINHSKTFIVYFVVPEKEYFFAPIFPTELVFLNAGVHRLNLDIYLRKTFYPSDQHLNNSAVISGNITDFYGNVSFITFNNTGSNGRYFLDHDFPYEGTYSLQLLIMNESIANTITKQTNIYVGSYSLNLSASPSHAVYGYSNVGLINLYASDINGFYQEGGNAYMKILHPNGSVYLDGLSMSDAKMGDYFRVFITPNISGEYDVEINFSIGNNSATTNTSFNVSEAVITVPGAGSGGGGGISVFIPYQIIVSIEEGYAVRGGLVPGVITLYNPRNYNVPISLSYWLEDSEGNVYSKTKEVLNEVFEKEIIIHRNLQLPEDSSTGKWFFHAAYILADSSEIPAYTEFRVRSMKIEIFLIIFTLLFTIIAYIIYRVRQHKENEDDYY